MNNVTHFGAKGDGKTDDTAALQHAIDQSSGLIEFPSGTFLIKKTLVVDLTKKGPMSIRGAAGSTSIVMKGPGPAFRLVGSHKGTADPKSWTDKTRLQERFPNVTGIEIRGEHPDAIGIELIETAKPTIQNIFIRECRVGIHVRQRNRDILIADSHIYNNEDYGLFLDHVNLHQMNVCGCHISYNKGAAIAMIGGDLHNLQFTGNDIEYSHSADLKRSDSSDILIDARNGIASEITFASNTIQGKASVNGANVRILGRIDAEGFPSARLIAITGNILGSQSTSVQMQFAQRVTLTGNTIYDGHTAGLKAIDCDGLVIANNVHGWSHQPKSPRPDHYELERCVGVSITGEVFQNAGGTEGENTGVICLKDCREVALGQLVIRNPRKRGIRIENSSVITVSGCTITTDRKEELSASIELTGQSTDIVVSGNVLAAGRRGSVAGLNETVVVSGNRVV
ncbi:MAG: right-handed parallel beta-helix repeat-containing protein [bacterium]